MLYADGNKRQFHVKLWVKSSLLHGAYTPHAELSVQEIWYYHCKMKNFVKIHYGVNYGHLNTIADALI